jgi:hypothetical protein
VDLFEAGKGGHKLYRIPGLVVTARGTVLAYCEARRHTGLDWDDIEILLRRSTDGGKTWSEPQALPHPAGRLARNPAALANAELARRAPLAREGQSAFNNPVKEPICMASLCRLSRMPYDTSSAISRSLVPPIRSASSLRARRSRRLIVASRRAAEDAGAGAPSPLGLRPRRPFRFFSRLLL